jgi:thiamine-phosphate pyrophosphorylase
MMISTLAAQYRAAQRAFRSPVLRHQNYRSPLCLLLEADAGERVATRLLVEQVIAGGAALVCYQAQRKSTRLMVEEAAELAWQCRVAQVPLLVYRRADVALAACAEGVLLEPEDLPVAVARRLLGPHAIIGAAIQCLSDAIEAERQGASYLTMGPVFPAPEASSPTAVSLRVVREITETTPLPVCLRGGIALSNVERLRGTGAKLVGVESTSLPPREARNTARALIDALAGPLPVVER